MTHDPEDLQIEHGPIGGRADQMVAGLPGEERLRAPRTAIGRRNFLEGTVKALAGVVVGNPARAATAVVGAAELALGTVQASNETAGAENAQSLQKLEAFVAGERAQQAAQNLAWLNTINSLGGDSSTDRFMQSAAGQSAVKKLASGIARSDTMRADTVSAFNYALQYLHTVRGQYDPKTIDSNGKYYIADMLTALGLAYTPNSSKAANPQQNHQLRILSTVQASLSAMSLYTQSADLQSGIQGVMIQQARLMAWQAGVSQVASNTLGQQGEREDQQVQQIPQVVAACLYNAINQ